MFAVGWHRWIGFRTDQLDMFRWNLTLGFFTLAVHRESLDWFNNLIKRNRELIKGNREAEKKVGQFKVGLERLRDGGAL